MLGFYSPWDDQEVTVKIDMKEEPKYSVDKGYCLHKWLKYIGLNKMFEYCDFCDEKKDDK